MPHCLSISQCPDPTCLLVNVTKRGDQGDNILVVFFCSVPDLRTAIAILLAGSTWPQ